MANGDEKPCHKRGGVNSAKGLAQYLSKFQQKRLPEFASSLKIFLGTCDPNQRERLGAAVDALGQLFEERDGTTEENKQELRKHFFQVYNRFCLEFQKGGGPLERDSQRLVQQNARDYLQNECQEVSAFCRGCHKAFRTALGLEIHQRTCQAMAEEAFEPKDTFFEDKITCNFCGVLCDTPFELVIHQKQCRRLSETTLSEESSLSDAAKINEEGTVQSQKVILCGICRQPAGKDLRELKKHQLFCSKGRKNSNVSDSSVDYHPANHDSSKSNSKEFDHVVALEDTGHSESSPRNCEHCGFICKTPVGLSVHQRKCEKRRQQLRELYGSETLNEVHTCENCGKQCISFYGLCMHQRKCLKGSAHSETPEHSTKRPRTNFQPESLSMSDGVIKKSRRTVKKGGLSCALCPSATASSGSFDDFVGPFGNTIGRPGKPSLYVHLECALWAPEVYQDRVTKEVCQVYNAYRRSRKKICDYCGEFGASVPCLHKGCKKSYHYCCLANAKCFMDSSKFEAFCAHHSPRNASMLNSISLENSAAVNYPDEETQFDKSRMTVDGKQVCETIFSRSLKVISHVVYPEKLPHQFVLPWRENNCLILKQVSSRDEPMLLFTWSMFDEEAKSSPLLCGNEGFFLRRNLRKYLNKASSNMQLRILLPSSQNNLHCDVSWFERQKATISCVLRNRRKSTTVRRFCWLLKDDSLHEAPCGFPEQTGQLKHSVNEKSSKEDRQLLKLESRKLEKNSRTCSLSSNDRNVKNFTSESRKSDSDIGLFGGKEHLRNIFTESFHQDKRARADTKTVVPLSTTLSFTKSLGGNSKDDKENEQLDRNRKSLRLDDIFSVDLDGSVVEQVCAPPNDV